MTLIVLMGIAWIALLAWVVSLYWGGCDHPNLTGVANYYDDEFNVFVHQKTCDDCGAMVVTFER